MTSVICLESMHALTGTAVFIRQLSANFLWRVASVICVESMQALTRTAVLIHIFWLTSYRECHILLVWKACTAVSICRLLANLSGRVTSVICVESMQALTRTVVSIH